MAQQCEFTGKKPMAGNNVSHANNKTKTRWNLNLHKKKYFIPELSKSITISVSTRAIRTIDKYGDLTHALLAAKEEVLSEKLKRIRSAIKKKAQAPQKQAIA